MTQTPSFTLAGAGLAGALMAILLARRGAKVRLLERRPDLRKRQLSAGRSINLALAERGIHALKLAGVFEAVKPLLIPMPGRMVHDESGQTRFVRYGQGEHEQIYSVSRPGLNALLLDQAERFSQVRIEFERACTHIDFVGQRVVLDDEATHTTHTEESTALIGADGAGSAVRQSLLDHYRFACTTEVLSHGYKELTLPPDAQGRHAFDPNALHIWPRGGFMLIALPNLDGSFTVTLFLPFAGEESFESLSNAAQVGAFFSNYFPDAAARMPDLAQEFFAHPTGKMTTVRSERWSNGTDTILIGDAAHAIVPFHGQGMNCAFEDCIELDDLLAASPLDQAIRSFEHRRKANANAIADMALENYVEMRDTVRDAKFLLQKELSFELERRFPDRFIPRYSMVMFHHDISYADAYERGRIQKEILDELTREAVSLAEVDLSRAGKLVTAKLPLIPAQMSG